MKNLWPGNLFPFSLLGPGLRIGSILQRTIFSSRRDPVRVYVSVPEEQTVIYENEFMTCSTALENNINEIIPLEAELSYISDKKSDSKINILESKTFIEVEEENKVVIL